MADTRLTALELDWTDEQKRLIGQITPEATGLVIAVRTDKESVPNEFGGLDASEADKRFVNVLHESGAEVLQRLGGEDVDVAQFRNVIGIAAAW
jgi:hypothetical protein